MDWQFRNEEPSEPDAQSGGPDLGKFDMPTTHGAPACQICGRRDETLRAVTVPYVISLLVVTMRRAWVGVFCWRHRIQRVLAAGFITSLMGWWGIPWGVIHTPVALYKLLKGGDIPEDENVELLARVGVHVLNTGEPGQAIRIFEESLGIKEDERTRKSLLQLHAKYPLSHELSDPRSPVWYVSGLTLASLIGMGIGLLDYLIVTFLGWILGSETNILFAILSWAPWVALLFVGALILSELLQKVYVRTQTDHLLISLIMGLGCAGLLWYGIPQGYLITDYLSAIIGGLAFESAGDFILTTGAVITQGGVWFVLDSFESGLAGDWIYLLIWGVAGILYAWTGFARAQESVQWRVRLELLHGELRIDEPRSRLPAWVALSGFAFILLVGFSIFAGQGRLLRGGPELTAYIERGDEFFLAGDYDQAEEAYRRAIEIAPNLPGPHDSLAWVLYSKGDYSGAQAEFGRAMEIDPRWADPHIGMGYIHLTLQDAQAAEQDFQTALNLADDPYYAGQAYHGLGSLAHQVDDLDSAIAYYQQAVREDWQLSMAHIDMAIAYYAMSEYSRAVEHANDLLGLSPNWGAPHALLAMAHYQLDQLDLMERELNWAEDLNSSDLYSQLLLAEVYWELEDYASAKDVLNFANALYPENPQVPLLIARLHALEGNFDEAIVLIETQITLNPEMVDAYLARAWVRVEKLDLGQAMSDVDKALGLKPESWEAHNLRSFVFFHQGNTEGAFQEAGYAIQLYPYEGTSYVNRAFAARAKGDLEGAFADAQRAIELSPKLDLAHFILGVIYLDRGDAQQGAASLETFLELARDRAYVRDYIQQAQAVLAQLP